MSYPFCGCCQYSDEGRPSAECHPRCAILNEMDKQNREKRNNEIKIKEMNLDIEIAKDLAKKHNIPEILSKFITG